MSLVFIAGCIQFTPNALGVSVFIGGCYLHGKFSMHFDVYCVLSMIIWADLCYLCVIRSTLDLRHTMYPDGRSGELLQQSHCSHE